MILPKIDSRNFSDLDEKTISNDKKNRDKCIVDVTDFKGRTNLCCCYVIDDDGRYVSPCYMPVDDCCRC